MDEVVEALEKYQGLVPLVYDIETMGLDEARPQEMPYAVYLKREADRVIAHQKYKRCLAMAGYCATKCVESQYTYKSYFTHKSEFRIGHYRKWYKRWLELADKFKEAK